MKNRPNKYVRSGLIVAGSAWLGLAVGGLVKDYNKSELEAAQWGYKEAATNTEHATRVLDEYRLTLPDQCLRALGRYTFGGEFEQLPAIESEQQLKPQCGSIDIAQARDYTNIALVAIAQKDQANEVLINAERDNASAGVETVKWMSLFLSLGVLAVIMRNRTSS